MAKREISASSLVDQVAGLADEIQKATVREVRKYLAIRLADMAKGTVKADDEVYACQDGTDFEITADFRAGLAFAAELIADQNFDY